MTNFRRGIVTATARGNGTVQEMTEWNTKHGRQIALDFDRSRFLIVDTHRRNLTFGSDSQPLDDGITVRKFRNPVVGDVIMYTVRWEDGDLRVIEWTFEAHYKESEDKLPRCAHQGGCTNAPRLTWRYCRTHEEDHYQEMRDLENEDGEVTPGEVLSLAIAAMGNTEEAREAARNFPGDFI